MKKSSLGRKSCAREGNPSREGMPKKSEMFERKTTGVPLLPRCSSTVSLPGTSTVSKKRELSLDRISSSARRDLVTDRTSEYNATVLQAGTPRTPSSRLSTGRSSSVSSMKGDNRPLKDKEWQTEAVDMVVKALSLDVEGSNILTTYKGVRPGLPLACFLAICNFLLHKLDPKVGINKANYLTDLPYYLKLLSYKGRMDKTMLQTVYTNHVWPPVLGIFHFLAELVLAIEDFKANHLNIMFPNSIDKDNSDNNDLNLKFFVPVLKYLWEKYQSENISITELVKSHGALIEEAIRSSGFTADVFEQEKEKRKIFEEARQKHQQAVETLLKIQSQLNEENTLLKCNQKKTESLRKEVEEVRLKYQREAENIQEIERNQLTIENEIKVLDNMIAQSKDTDEENMTPEEYETYKETKSKLKNDLEYQKRALFDLEELLLDETLTIAKLKEQTDKLLKEYNKKIIEVVKEVVEEPCGLRGAMCFTRPRLGETPCNEATAHLLNRALQYYQARLDQLQQQSVADAKQQQKNSMEVEEKLYELDKLKTIHLEEMKKMDKIKCHLKEQVVRVRRENKEAADQIETAQRRLEKNHKDYAQLENEVMIKEKRLRKFYDIHQRKLKIRYECLVELHQKYRAHLNRFKGTFFHFSQELAEMKSKLREKLNLCDRDSTQDRTEDSTQDRTEDSTQDRTEESS